jgi:hypothetical protein
MFFDSLPIRDPIPVFPFFDEWGQHLSPIEGRRGFLSVQSKIDIVGLPRPGNIS